MSDPDEIVETSREGEDEGSQFETNAGGSPLRDRTKRKGSGRRRNSGRSQVSVRSSVGGGEGNESEEQNARQRVYIQEIGSEGSKLKAGGSSIRQDGGKRKGSMNHRNSGGSQDSIQNSRSGQGLEGGGKESVGCERIVQQEEDGGNEDVLPIQEDHQTRFYEDYRKVAEEYDREFLKKHEEDLDTTLIFAGLFSAVTSAFIIQVDSQLRPDSGDETAALLRVLIYKIDNTTFGDNAPALPQWNGPPPPIVQVQAILFASLTASLLSAFLAMLGKQWLNRYASNDVRGTVVERGQC